MEYLRETVVRDVVDVLGMVKDKDYNELINKFSNNKYSTSIASRSKDLIMTFPVICSNTLDPKTATMVSKAIERKCVTMLHILFSACTISDAKSAQEFIAQYHKNISMNMSVDDMIKVSAEIGDELGSSFGAEMNMAIQAAREDANNLYRETEFLDSVNESSINDYKVINHNGNTMILKEAEDHTSQYWVEERLFADKKEQS